MKQILVVDDEPRIADICRDYLERAGFTVVTAANGADALTLARTKQPDLVVLDLGLPKMDGLDVTRALRKQSNVPIIMLTARVDESDKLVGLELGADDYLTKPFSPQELTLRVAALLRRLAAPAVAAGSSLVEGSLVIDRGAHRVTLEGEEVPLTATEFKLLLTLVERRGRVQTRPQLLETVWDAQPDIQTRTVDMHVQRLRAKLGGIGDLIETVRGFGYRFKGVGK
jgi:two-component system, OmpR family, phosphate regulon response regulator PhoB